MVQQCENRCTDGGYCERLRLACVYKEERGEGEQLPPISP